MCLDFGDGSPIINDSVPSYVYNSTGTYTVRMTVENSAGCDDTSDRQIVVHDFGLTLSSDKDYIDRGGTVTLTALGTETYTILAWLPEHLFVQQHDYSQLTRVDSSVTYIAVGLSWAGCIDTAAVRVEVTPEVFVLSAFSPNGDGRNDHFRLISNGSIEIEDFSVFDCWGNQVWKGYGGDGERGWDGTYRDSCYAAHFNMSTRQWEPGDTAAAQGLDNMYWQTIMGVTTLSPFTVGSVGSPLSVEQRINKQGAITYTIYPNPVSNSELRIRSSETIAKMDIRVMDVVGSVWLNQQVDRSSNRTNEVRLDVSTLPQGTYLLELKDTNGHTTTTRFTRL